MPQLEYGQPLRMTQRKLGRRLKLAVILFLAGACVYEWRPSWREIKHGYYRRQCLAYTMKSDQIVYAEDAKKTALLYPAKPGRRYVPLPSSPPAVSTVIVPACWREFRYLSQGAAPMPVVFLHERTTPNGRSNLVAVIFEEWAGRHSWQFSYETSAPDGTSQSSGYYAVDFPEDVSPGTLKFFAGQPDSADSSHFMIGYSVDGRSGTIDGRLTNGAEVQLSVRDGPSGPRCRGHDV